MIGKLAYLNPRSGNAAGEVRWKGRTVMSIHVDMWLLSRNSVPSTAAHHRQRHSSPELPSNTPFPVSIPISYTRSTLSHVPTQPLNPPNLPPTLLCARPAPRPRVLSPPQKPSDKPNSSPSSIEGGAVPRGGQARAYSRGGSLGACDNSPIQIWAATFAASQSQLLT